MDEYTDISRKMKAPPQVDLPADFTKKVMEHILREPKGPFPRLWQGLNRTPGYAPRGLLSARAWCALCFIMSGLLFAIMGSGLLIAMKDIPRSPFISTGVTTQPSLFIATSLWLVVLGTLIYFTGWQVAPLVKIGSLLFTVVFLLNGALIRVFPSRVVHFFTTPISSSAVVMGLILYHDVSFNAQTCK